MGSQEVVARLHNCGAASRLFAGDTSFYGEDLAAATAPWVGWVDCSAATAPELARAEALAAELRSAGIDRVVLCGMGGSGLAPFVLAAASDRLSEEGGPGLLLADTTHPDFLQREATRDISHTVFVFSSKSGSTVETQSHLAFFTAVLRAQGLPAERHTVFITDPGSKLEQQARELGAPVFSGIPEVGGRFSALTVFGLVPTILAGISPTVVQQAQAARAVLSADAAANPAMQLAAYLTAAETDGGVLSLGGDSPATRALVLWIEQLVAESTGKGGRGLLPLAAGSISGTKYRVELRVLSSEDGAGALPQVETVDGEIRVSATLGGHFLLWEAATAFLGVTLGLNPFDQPDVESAKAAARAVLGGANAEAADVVSPAASEPQVLASQALDFVSAHGERAPYVCLQLYADPASDLMVLAESVRDRLASRLGVPVQLALGPRYLHSSGQLHKGGPAGGVFLQLVQPGEHEVPIPGSAFSYRELLRAQADGDLSVLESLGRHTLQLVTQNMAVLLQQLEQLL